ncbi:hypothetical protein ACF0H5_020026 [Mactra antiquata]
MDLTRVVMLCSCVIVHFLEATYSAHATADRRVVPGIRVMQGSPIPRVVARPTGIAPTRNVARRNMMIPRGNFARYNQQSAWVFPSERLPARFPSGGVAQNVRNVNIQPTWSSVPAIPQEQINRQLPDTGAQPFNRRFVVDSARNPFSSGMPKQNNVRVINKPGSSSQTNKNSLLRLLEERRPVLRDDRDSQLIRTHLTELNNFRNDRFSNPEEQLQKQVNYIERILDIDIQREVLKIFVKDIVEKSGFLNMDANTVQDINSLQMLVDKIRMVTKNFSNLENPSFNDGTDPGFRVQVVTAPSTTTTRATTPTDTSRQEADLRRRIAIALSSYNRPSRLPASSRETSNARSGDMSLQTFEGRRGRPSVGMSIFGSPVENTSTSQTTIIVTESKRGINTEPLGGNTAYWTHLRSGLADMLCNLCQQQGEEACIRRYCTNDVIVEQATPRPKSTRPPVIIETTTLPMV